jgi:Flp pilus assembly protein TadD
VEELWDLCPGYEHNNDLFAREVTLTCIFCHNGRMVPVEGSKNVYEPPLPHGIGCERCHGPGRLHVEHWSDPDREMTREGDAIVNPRTLPREERIQVCFQCHFGDSRTSQRVPLRDRSLLDFRPGMPITEAMVPFSLRVVPRREFGLTSQVDRLIRSRCYTESEGELECLTCHNPHVSVYSPDRPADFFTRRCLECHAVEACTASMERRRSTEPPDDCVACHMRKAESDDQRHAEFTDHWIRREIDEHGGEPLVPEMVPVFPETFAELGADERAFYRARAHMLAALSLPAAREALWNAAEGSFRDAIREGLDGSDTWAFLGMVLDFLGKLPDAEQAFARAHAEDPEDREAAFNLGTVKLRLGKIDEAASIFRELSEKDPQDVGALAELGRSALMAGKNEQALEFYDRAVLLAPTLAALRTNRGAALARMGRLEEAASAVEEATRLNPEDAGLWTFWSELLKRTGRPDDAAEAERIARRLAATPRTEPQGPRMGQ